MPTANYKLTVTLPSGTVLTYITVGAVTETADKKTFTGRRSGESADGVCTVYISKIVDQKLEPLP
jgi:hypothetical protein